MRVWWRISRATIVFVCVSLAACATGGEGEEGRDSGDGRETIAVFTKNQTNPFFETVRTGADHAANQMGADVIHYIPTRPDSIPEQMSQVEDVVISRPDAIVFTPVDSQAMVPGVEQLNAAGIPIVNITDPVLGGSRVSFMGCDEFNLALNTGRYLLDAIGAAGNVVILEGVGGSINSNNRVGGFMAAVEEYPDVTLLASQPGNFQRLQALQVMENLIQSYPQIDGVLAANDSMALGAVEALDAANRDALVVGLNGTKEAIDAIKAGTLLASGDCDGYMHGCMGTMAAVRHLRNLPVPEEFLFPITVIDETNYQPLDVPLDQRVCPAWETVVGND
jgi:ribose transport system substrate-binding protein